jgi:threonine/homoserine/homoserine lactone efflux protein
MIILAQVSSILLLQLLGLASPGPAFLLGAKHGISYPRRVHLATAIGLGLGSTFYTVLGFLGVSAVIAQSPIIYGSIKFAGAFYLIYLGFKSILSKKQMMALEQVTGEPAAELTPFAAFRIGAILNMSNPKTALFYLALFTSIISPDTPVIVKVLVLLLTPPMACGWYAFVATSFSLSWFQAFYGRFKLWVDYLFGGAMIVLGVMIAFS